MPSPHVRFGPFHLEDEPVRLKRGTHTVPLRRKSLEVLKYLAERPGQLVSKEELFKRIWSGRVISNSGLRLCVSEIRAALGDNADTPYYLETIVGRGYRFLESRDGRALFPDTAGPIVGRDAELNRLEDYYRRAADGRRQFVLLSGEPGIGKTTLIRCFIGRVVAHSRAKVFQAQCLVHYGKGEAYGPLLQAIARWCDGQSGMETMKIFKRYAPSWLLQIPGLMDPAEYEQLQRQVEGAMPDRMTRELAQAVEALSAQTPLILVVEDLQWADQSTIDALAALAHDTVASRLLTLGTYRPVDAVLYAKNLRNAIQELKSRSQCEEISLELLSQEDVADYLNGRLGGDVSNELTTKIYRRTIGNPLFMVNIVEGLIQQQALILRHGQWIASSQAQRLVEGMPESLRSLISRRLEALPNEQKTLLETASVAGLSFTAAAISSALDQTMTDIEAQCDAMVAQGQFIETMGVDEWPDGTLTGRYCFRHPLYLEVLYEQIGEARRARAHRCIGDRLETAYGNRVSEIAAELAAHFERGGKMGHTIRYRNLAAGQALKRHAYPEAVGQFKRALHAIEQMPETTEHAQLELEILLQLGSCLIATGGYAAPEVEQTFTRAHELCGQLDNASYRFSILWNLAAHDMVRGDLAQSGSIIEECLVLAKASGDAVLDLMANDALAQQLFFEGQLTPAHGHFESVITRYDSEQHRHLAETYSEEDPGVACASLDALVLWLLGFPDQSMDRLRAVQTLSKELGNPHSSAFGLAFAGFTYQLRRDPLAAQKTADELIQLSKEHAMTLISLGEVLKGWALAQQNADIAYLELAKRGLARWREAGAGINAPYCLSLLAETQRALGQIEDAQASVTEALSLVDINKERWFEAELHRLHGELILEQDSKQQTEAVRCFTQSLKVAREQQAKSLELRSALSLSRLWVQQGQTQEARQLLNPIVTWFSEGLDSEELRDAKSIMKRCSVGKS